MNFESILILILAFVVSLRVTPLVIKFYKKKKWIDDPAKGNEEKIVHDKPVPRGGGIPIFLGIIISCLLFLPIDKHLIGILLGALILLITGILDDIYDLNPKLRLLIGFVAAGMVVASGIGIAFLSNPFNKEIIRLDQPQIPIFLLGKTRSIWIVADIFALIWIVAIMNFVNWSKGLDGQMPGIVIIAAVTIAILSERFSADITQWSTRDLALAVAGVYLGFLVWNIYPQKIMPGYGGGSMAGYFLAVLAILSTTKVGTLFMVLGVPLIDAILVIIRRILAKKSPLKGDTRHLHHSLMRLGWGKKRIAGFYWIVTLVLGLASLLLNGQQKLYTIGLLFGLFIIFLVWEKFLKT